MRLQLLLLCFVTVSLLSAQDFSGLSSLKDLQRVSKKAALDLPEPPEIEHAIDESVYILGPGDVLSIIVGGNAEEEQQLMVTPEGTLVFPSSGTVPVAGMVLKEAKSKIAGHLEKQYLSQEIETSLIQLRTFRVTVSGAVNFPGLVSVNALDRVSDAVFMAGGLVELPQAFPQPENPREKQRGILKTKPEIELTEEQYAELEENVASKRNIVIKRRDGAELRADLQKFDIAGDLETNPHLLDGDVIIVPTVQKEVGEISIAGAVRTPGTFEYANGDRVRDLLDMAHGFSIDADSSKIIIVRFIGNSSRAQEMALALDWSDSSQIAGLLNTLLLPDDRVFVRSHPKYHKKRTVEVVGEVLYPGEYALLHTPTYLTEIIQAAGGFTDSAALNAAHIVRRSYEDLKDPEYDRLDLIMVADMDRDEKAYYRERSREMKGLVSTNFVALFEEGEKEYDTALNDKDMIVVPTKDYTVNVIGHVKNPGLVPYVPGKRYDYYIQKAGGYNIDAWKRKVRIQKAGTGELLAAKRTPVEMGDMVYVPEKIETENIVRDVALITVQLATVVMLVVQTNWYATRP